MSEKKPEDDYDEDDWAPYRKVIMSMGRPKDLQRNMEALEQMIKERERGIWLAALIKGTALWLVPVLAAWTVFKDSIIALFSGVGK